MHLVGKYRDNFGFKIASEWTVNRLIVSGLKISYLPQGKLGLDNKISVTDLSDSNFDLQKLVQYDYTVTNTEEREEWLKLWLRHPKGKR